MFEATGVERKRLEAPSTILALAASSGELPWLGLVDGVAGTRGDRVRRLEIDPPVEVNVSALREDGPGLLWLTTAAGTLRLTIGPDAGPQILMDSSGAIMLEVYRHPKASVPEYNRMDPLLLHLAFASHDPAADRDRLVQAGARLVDDLQTTPNGDQLVMLRDPWGVALQLVRRTTPMLKVK